MHHMPVVGLKPFCRVVGKPALGFPVYGDAVVVIEANQLAQPQRARERTDLMGDPLHQTAVTHKDVRVVIDDVMPRLVKLRTQRAFRDGQPNGVG